MAGLCNVSYFTGRIRYSCKYPSCNNSYFTNIKGSYQNKKFFHFPKDSNTHAAWKFVCQISPSKNCRNFFVCENHFTFYDFIDLQRKTLKKGSIPQALAKCQLETEHNYAAAPKPRFLFGDNTFPEMDNILHDTSFTSMGENLDIQNNDTENSKLPSSQSCVLPICHLEVEQCVAVSKPKLIVSDPITSELSKYAQPTVLPDNDINVNKAHKSNDTIIKHILEPSTTQDSSYYLSKQDPESSPTCFKPNTLPDKYSFLLEKNKGILTKAGLSKSNLSPQENIMYQVHRNTLSKLSK
mgnify:FL=1